MARSRGPRAVRLAGTIALGTVAMGLLALPALASGQLLVESEPAGAQVLIDGQSVGRTPLLTGNVPDGPHEVVLRRKGYREGRMGVRVVRDLTTRKSLRLVAKGAAGELRVTSAPSGATVLLDGTPVGRTPLHLDQVRAGHHTLALRRAGFRERTQAIRVVADLTTSRELRLEGLPPAPRAEKPAARPVVRPPVTRRPLRPVLAPPSFKAARQPASRPAVPTPAPIVQAPRPVATPAPIVRPPHPRATPVAPRPAATPEVLSPQIPPAPAPAPGLPWKHMAFYGLMGMFLAWVVGVLWQRREAPGDWQEDKPMARYHPLTPGRVPMAAVECCLRAMRLIQAGQAELGAETMLAAYRQAPTVQMIYNLAIAWHLAGSPLAETAYRTAIQLDPAHRDARFNLAKLLVDRDRSLEALLAYRELVAAVPGDGAAWFNLGTLCARLGLGTEAVRALRRARKLLGDDVACRQNLRLAKRLKPWWRLGRRPKPLVLSSGSGGAWV